MVEPAFHAQESSEEKIVQNKCDFPLRLSKTQMRTAGISGCSTTTLEPQQPLLGYRAADQRVRIYRALLGLATPASDPSNWKGFLFELPEWVLPFEKAGISYPIVRKQRISWLTDPNHVSDTLKQRFSWQSLISSGVFDPDGEFRFYRHRVLIPFSGGEEGGYFVGLDPDSGFSDLLGPTSNWSVPYRVPLAESDSLHESLYLTSEIDTALRLGSLGLTAYAVQSAEHLLHDTLRKFENRNLIYCPGHHHLTLEKLEPYRIKLEPCCRKFSWQPLEQIETYWLLVQSRAERGSRVSDDSTRLQHPWLQRMAQVIQNQKSSIRRMFSR